MGHNDVRDNGKMTTEKTPYCIIVQPFMIDEMWDKCLPFLENPDIDELEFDDLDELREQCKRTESQLWIIMLDDDLKGCFITTLGEHSSGIKVINMSYFSGEGIRLWADTVDKAMIEFGIKNNCRYYSFIGRRGFSKMVPALKESGVLYLRDINVKED